MSSPVLRGLAAGAALALAGATPAAAIDYLPFDWVPLPAGTNVAMLYYDHGHDNAFNNQLTGTTKARLDSHIGVVRYLHYGDLFDHRFVLDLVAPFGSLTDGKIGETRLGSGSGFGDPLVSLGYWFVNDPSQKRYLSGVVFVTLPIGTYDHNRALNLGSNRWQNDLQLDFTQGLGKRYTIDVSADWIAYGDNTDAGPNRRTLKQNSTYGAYAWLTRDVTSEIRRVAPHAGQAYVSVGYLGTWGGAEKLDGQRNGDRTEEQQIRLSYSQFVTPTLEATVSVSHDVEARGQFKQDFGLLFRLAKMF